MLRNAVRECCKHADCDLMEKIFICANWTYADSITEESYIPTSRELRNVLYKLGTEALNSLIKDYENGKWSKDDFHPHTIMSGRLFFTIYWEGANENVDFINDITFSCGINHDFAVSSFENVDDNYYDINTCGEDEEYAESFNMKP